MNLKEIIIKYREFSGVDDLPVLYKELVLSARQASGNAWAPYSGFRVGAAVRLLSGRVITGNNQENAAYPEGLCAERTALFYAGANYPGDPVEIIAVSASTHSGQVSLPVKPCGGCRQALLEVENRYNRQVTIVLDGADSVIVLDGVDSLLPLNFRPDSLKS
jgi:cytidine deaminase